MAIDLRLGFTLGCAFEVAAQIQLVHQRLEPIRNANVRHIRLPALNVRPHLQHIPLPNVISLPSGPGMRYRFDRNARLFSSLNPLCFTLFTASSHMSLGESFHTCAATLYSSISGSRVKWNCSGSSARHMSATRQANKSTHPSRSTRAGRWQRSLGTGSWCSQETASCC